MKQTNQIKDKYGNELFSMRLSGMCGGQPMLISNKERELLTESIHLENNLGDKKAAEKLNVQIRKLRAAAEKMEASN